METKKKIIFFIITTLILGTIVFLIIRNTDGNPVKSEDDSNIAEKNNAVLEDIDYEKYLELRSLAHEQETYAIVIWSSTEEVSINYVNEVKGAFANRKSVVYLLDTTKLNEGDKSRVIDDVTTILKYKEPGLIIPTILVMSKGEVVYSHDGFIYKEELMENLNAKSIE